MKTKNLSPHQALVRQLLDMLGLNTTNLEAAEIAESGQTTKEIVAEIRKRYGTFDDIPASFPHGEKKSVFVLRHGVGLTEVIQALLAFWEETTEFPSEIEYTTVSKAYAPEYRDRGPAGFAEFLAKNGLKLSRKTGKRINNKWWRIQPSEMEQV